MDLRKLSIMLLVIGILLILLSTVYLVNIKQRIKEYRESINIDPDKAYESCIYLGKGYNVTITMESNGTCTFMFYSINNREIIENKTVNEYFFSLNHTTKYDDTYCILLSNNNSKTISINYDLIVSFRTTIERYPFITLFGISFIIGSIFLFYYTIISRQREYPSLIETKDIVCKSKSLNKHECVISVDHSISPNIIIEYLVKSVGYKVKRKLKETIIELSYKGKFMGKKFSEKSRTIIVYLEEGRIVLNYILPPLNASGSIDLKDIFEEVSKLKDFIGSRNQ